MVLWSAATAVGAKAAEVCNRWGRGDSLLTPDPPCRTAFLFFRQVVDTEMM